MVLVEIVNDLPLHCRFRRNFVLKLKLPDANRAAAKPIEAEVVEKNSGMILDAYEERVGVRSDLSEGLQRRYLVGIGIYERPRTRHRNGRQDTVRIRHLQMESDDDD